MKKVLCIKDMGVLATNWDTFFPDKETARSEEFIRVGKSRIFYHDFPKNFQEVIGGEVMKPKWRVWDRVMWWDSACIIHGVSKDCGSFLYHVRNSFLAHDDIRKPTKEELDLYFQ